MSLFGTSPTEDEPAMVASPSRSAGRGGGGGGGGLFDEPSHKTSSSNLFADDGDDDSSSPWDMPTPRKRQSRADMIRNLLPASDVPDSYIEAFDSVLRQDGSNGRITTRGILNVFAMAGLESDTQTRIMSQVAPASAGDDLSLDRNEFNVLLALVALAQEGEVISLDSVDERRRSKSSHCYLPRKIVRLVLHTPQLSASRLDRHHVSLSPPLQAAKSVAY